MQRLCRQCGNPIDQTQALLCAIFSEPAHCATCDPAAIVRERPWPNIEIGEIGFTTRAFNMLKRRAKVDTLPDLKGRTVEELLPLVGQQTVDEVQEILAIYNLPPLAGAGADG